MSWTLISTKNVIQRRKILQKESSLNKDTFHIKEFTNPKNEQQITDNFLNPLICKMEVFSN